MFLVYLGLCSSQVFDLRPPFGKQNADEISYWSLLGVATNMKKSVHFSSDVNKQNGALCHRIPTSSMDWEANFSFSIDSGYLSLMFTEETCPFWVVANFLPIWNGFSLNITKLPNKSIGLRFISSNITVSTNDDLCTIQGDKARLLVRSSSGIVTIFVLENGKLMQCGKELSFPFNYLGFFSFLASGLQKEGFSDVYDFYLKLPANHTEPFSINDLNEHSRTNIKNQVTGFAVSSPRSLELGLVLDEMERLDHILSANDLKVVEDNIAKIMSSLQNSLQNTLSIDQLKELIGSKLQKHLSRIEHKIEKRKNSFKEIGDEMKTIVRAVEIKTQWLNDYVIESMSSAKDEAVITLSKFINMTADAQNLPLMAKNTAKDIKSEWIPTFLYVVAFIELTCYIAFFLVRKKKTHNFKKYD